MIFEGFVGSYGKELALDFSSSDVLNLYYEPGSPETRGRAAWVGTPGIALFRTAGIGPIRGLWAGEERLFAVSSGELYEIFADTAVLRGGVSTDNLPVNILPNGNQLGVVSDGHFYLDNGAGPSIVAFPAYTGVGNLNGQDLEWVSGDLFDQGLLGSAIQIGFYAGLTVIDVSDPDPDTPGGFRHLTLDVDTGATLAAQAFTITPFVTASSGCFIDGYFIVSRPGVKQFNISALNNGLDWDPLDYGSKEGYPDAIKRVFADHEDLWIFGDQQSTEVWQNTGNANFPFQRIPGNFIHFGLAARDSVVRVKNGIAWLSKDTERGGTILIYAQGFQPVRVSTPAVENAWTDFATVEDAVSYTYEYRGHEFVIINFPTANQTWCWDASTNLWSRRGWWNGALNVAQRQINHAFVGLAAHGAASAIPPRHYVGDRGSGKIYVMSAASFTDDGVDIEAIRSAPSIAQENRRRFYHRFELLTESRDDSMTLTSISNQGASSITRPPSTTTVDTFGARTFWNQLGSARDRVFQIRSRAHAFKAWIQAYVEFTEGMN